MMNVKLKQIKVILITINKKPHIVIIICISHKSNVNVMAFILLALDKKLILSFN